MRIEKAIGTLEASNLALNKILEDIDKAFAEIRLDPKMKGLVEDLEDLFDAYLRTWIKTNIEVLDTLKKI